MIVMMFMIAVVMFPMGMVMIMAAITMFSMVVMDTILLSRTDSASAEKVQQAVDLLRSHNDRALIVIYLYHKIHPLSKVYLSYSTI